MLDTSPVGRALPRITIACLTAAWGLATASPAAAQEPCFQRLDNGVDMTGWQRSTTNHHGPGTGWTVEGGAMTGRQTAGALGGILMTNKTYSDVEVVLEVKIDWGCDSGIFFRTTAGDRAYQVNVDHLTGGGIGTIYGESFTTELRARDYTLTDQGNTAIVEPGHTPIFDLSKWSTIWHPTAFNEIRARIEGNPPHIQVWIASVKVMDFTDTQLRSEINPSGPLAIQVHGGTDRWVTGGTVQYRNIRAKDLTVACASAVDAGDARSVSNQPDSGAGGGPASIPDAAPAAASDAEPTPGASVDAAASAGQDPGPLPPSMPPGAAKVGDAGGCSCTTARSVGNAGAAGFLLLVLVVSSWRSARRGDDTTNSVAPSFVS
jgi:3-keto-disaccharide hydrolase